MKMTAQVNPIFLLQVGLLLVVFLLISVNPTAARERVRFDSGWKFTQEDVTSSQLFGIGTAITEWRWQGVENDMTGDLSPAAPEFNDSKWNTTKTGWDTFNGRIGFSWYRTIIPVTKHPVTIHFEGVDDNATVFLNGKRLLYHSGWNEAFDVDISSAVKANGPNVLAMLVENTAGIGGVIGSATVADKGEKYHIPYLAYSFNDSKWQNVHLPHDYVVENPPGPNGDGSHGFRGKGIGWYRKVFTLPKSDKGKTLWLEFDGIYQGSKVWLNGEFLGTHQSGYTSFHYDISKIALYGSKNVLVVRADSTHNEGWWYEGGGIYRHVWLTKLQPVHVSHWGTFITSVVPDGDKGRSDAAEITIRTSVDNDTTADAECMLVSRIINPKGNVVATVKSSLTISRGTNPEYTQVVQLTKPMLWSCDKPNIYQLRTSLLVNKKTVDSYNTPYGIRTIRFDAAEGFFLNGKRVEIKGTCNHQDFAGIGTALPDYVHFYKLKKLKEMGSNGYRCSHHPYAPELMDYADQLGFLVMDENRKLGDSPEILSQVESMVRRDRNHPSVIIWSMCNEEGLQGTPEGARMFAAMKAATRRLDTTRPVSCAMNGGFGSGISGTQEIQGFNYSTGEYDKFHSMFTNQPCYGSETASTLTTRGEYADNKGKCFVTSYNLTEWAWKPIAERPWMAGGFVWTGFDYRGEPTPYGWPCINSHFGIMDTCGFPKDNYYYYLAVWKDKPVVHIMPHWNWPGKEGQNIRVVTFSNCERVELLLNGKSIGSQDVERLTHLDWNVPYAAGKLVAIGTIGGKEVTRDTVETTGTPAKIRLRSDRTKILADGEDVAIIPVDILDSNNRVVPTADNLVTFEVKGQGTIDGVGNGNPSDLDPDKANQRHAFNGHCMVIVRPTEKAGSITITAGSVGLEGAAVTVVSGIK